MRIYWHKKSYLRKIAIEMCMGKDAYENMIKDSKYSDNKEFVIVSGATHTDLYDQKDVIPFDKIEKFLKNNL